jgi:hypothetical protein
MTNDSRRITLIARPAAASRDWNATPDASTRVIFVHAMTILQHALRNGVREFGRDVERVIADRAGSPAEYLDMLARLPHEFLGDVLLICADGSGFLSSVARGDGRILYALGAHDVDFYLLTHDLLGAAQMVA